ncbi:hypothetical protein RHMOL_Rhmol01G0103800 [Rhododendron molle]|uniref:Uncharacterized protein n=1 Tax=Rhododendron molle TaxID=49168 RepID=A0ACC0Q397_RHOML|nr:hypothetical protein RHMOL_Rhmol01G0103800 [Rhododendron molle]
MILVYEYMVNGTLASHLYKSSRDESGESVSPLKWAQRLNICLGAARGLDYLHIGTKQPIIHRDVKTTNILLDENWVAKVDEIEDEINRLNMEKYQLNPTEGWFLDAQHYFNEAVRRLEDEIGLGKAEVGYLGQLSHPNLVKLIGYCCEDEHRLLVYEHMASGSLEKHLFQRDCFTVTWPRRMKIALDAARALAFLHLAERPIIYQDFKHLARCDFNAKLTNCGLAKDGPMGDQTHVSTRVMGTCGYAAPEYIATGQLTTRSDVYGFGVVLLEMLVGRKAMDMSRPSGEHNLVEWARPHFIRNKKLLMILDPSVEGQYSTRTALKVAHLAYQCLSQTPKERPVMNQVVEILETLQTQEKALEAEGVAV